MDRTPSAGELLIQLLLALTGVAVMVWAEMPDWQRRLVMAKIMSRFRRVVAVMAIRSGRRAMSDELAGREREAQAGYRFTHRLSEIRDRL